MSVLASAIRGGLAGLGAGAAGIANKYIDEEIATQRAQMLADIQRNSAVQQTKDIDAYTNDPSRRERLRAEESKDLDARNAATLRGRVSEETNPDLRQARIDNEVAFLNGTTDARIAAQNKVTEGTAGTLLDQERMRRKVLDPMDVDKARGIADAQWAGRAAYDEHLEGKNGSGKGAKMSEAGKLQLQGLEKQDEQIAKTINDGVAGGTLKADPGDKSYAHLQRQRQAIQVQKLRIFAKEGVIDGNEDAMSLISSGASQADLDASVQQAKLIGGSYASAFESAVREHLKAKPNATPAAPAPSAPSAPAPSLMDQARKRQPAPEGSPQAAWDARQEQLRRTEAERGAKAEAERKRAQDEFDADLSQMQPLELLRKYDTPTARGRLDASRLARLKKLETTIR